MTEMPGYESEAEDIAKDARAERRLIWQALFAFVVVAAIVLVREVLLR